MKPVLKKWSSKDCTPELLGPEYRELFRTCAIEPSKFEELRDIVDELTMHKALYNDIGRRTGVPAMLVAALHERECSHNFSEHLHNGDPLDRPTVNVPENRPPWAGPFTFLESALDALSIKHPEKVPRWDIPHVLWFAERWNGFGYRINEKHGGKVWSPFLWGWTNHHRMGKFVSDHNFSPTAEEGQPGIVPLLMMLGWKEPK